MKRISSVFATVCLALSLTATSALAVPFTKENCHKSCDKALRIYDAMNFGAFQHFINPEKPADTPPPPDLPQDQYKRLRDIMRGSVVRAKTVCELKPALENVAPIKKIINDALQKYVGVGDFVANDLMD